MVDATEPPKQPRKRQRPGLSCLECRQRKVRCNQARPCDQCIKGRRPGCTYDPRSNAAAVPPDPWALGRPAPLGSSSLTTQDPGSLLPSAASASTSQGLMGSMTGSPNSELGVDETTRDKVSQPVVQSFPTPGTSPGMQVSDSEGRPSTLGSTSISQTPHRENFYPPQRTTKSGLYDGPTPQAALSQPTDNVRSQMRVKSGPIGKNPSSEPISFVHSSLTDISNVSGYGGRSFTL